MGDQAKSSNDFDYVTLNLMSMLKCQAWNSVKGDVSFPAKESRDPRLPHEPSGSPTDASHALILPKCNMNNDRERWSIRK